MDSLKYEPAYIVTQARALAKAEKPVDVVTLAEFIATLAHEGQFRRGGTPYIEHPRAVVGRMRYQEATLNELAAAWLHDVLEDTKMTWQDLLDAGIPQEVIRQEYTVRSGTPRISTSFGTVHGFSSFTKSIPGPCGFTAHCARFILASTAQCAVWTHEPTEHRSPR